jgi:two-component sensor histidine kinase
MRKHIEIGTGVAYGDDSFRAGYEAATQAVSRIRRYKPSLVLLFVSTQFDLQKVVYGVCSVTGHCPMAGSSSVREICQVPTSDSVAVTVFASPFLSAEVRVGKEVSKDCKGAIRRALPKGQAAAYFHEGQKIGRPFYFSHPSSGISPVFAFLFSPGMTLKKPSLSHEIHNFLRRCTLGRIPIVGGSSSSSDPALRNYQIANGKVYEDAVVLAVVETDLLFGVGVAHGFRPTQKRAIVTKAGGHIVYQLDDQPAAVACGRLMGLRLKELKRTPVWFSRMPFGIADAYGQHHLLVPERIFKGGAIQFAPIMESIEAITLMEIDPKKIGTAAGEAVRRALEIGNIKHPAAIIVFSCSLRHDLDHLDRDEEARGIVEQGRSLPLTGFLSFGEYGLTEEGLPIYCNQSIVVLVLSNDLDKSAINARRNATLFKDIEIQLKRKILELSSFRQANEIKFEGNNWMASLKEIPQIIKNLTGAQEVNFELDSIYVPSEATTPMVSIKGTREIKIPFISLGEHLGYMGIFGKSLKSLDVAIGICNLVAMRIHRVLQDKKFDEKAREIETLYNIAHEIVTGQDYRAVLVKISMEIQQHMGAKAFSLWLCNSQSKLIREVSSFDNRHVGDYELATQAVGSKQPQENRGPALFLIAVPLIFKEQVRGALVLSFEGEKKGFDGKLDFLNHLSINLAAMAEIYELNRRSSLMREIHHRVKNNLQIIASLLNLQLRRLDDAASRDALENSIRRIMSIAVVHEALCEKHLGQVDAIPLVKKISNLVTQGMAENGQEIQVMVGGASILMLSSQQATNLAVIMNELLNNAIKHGMNGLERGEIHISLTEENGKVVLSVLDNGKGLPDSFNLKKDKGLGLQLISTIAESEFAGQFSLEKRAHGLEARLIFSRDPLFVQ